MKNPVGPVFRISREPEVPAPGTTGATAVVAAAVAAAPPEPEFQAYLERLMKLIPSEVIALYLIGAGVIQPHQPWYLVAWSVFCFLAVVLVRSRGTTNPRAAEGPQWGAVAIAAVSYIVWIYSLGGPFAAFPSHTLHQPVLGSLLVLAWTFVVPYFYRG